MAADAKEATEATGAELKVLTAGEILAADDRKMEPVDVPEWKGRVFVRSMRGDERDAFDASGVSDEGESDKNAFLVNYRARLVAFTCCDETGNLLFTQHQVASLGCKNSTALNRVVRVAQKLNGLTAAAVEEAKKNSEEAPSAGSPTASP